MISGITFSLGKITTQPVTVNVTQKHRRDPEQRHGLRLGLQRPQHLPGHRDQYDPTTGTAAPLQGDSTAVSIQNQMHNLISKVTGASSTFSTLSSLGIQLQTDGSLQLDSATFTNALNNLPQLTKALSNVDATNPSNNGFGGDLLELGRFDAADRRHAARQDGLDPVEHRLEPEGPGQL